MLIAMIAAMAQNRVIGAGGEMPWHLPADLQRFKRLTMGQTLLMGRETYQSIGRPLPGRQTIILSRDPGYSVDGCVVVPSLVAGVAAATTEKLFICGGGEVYRAALALAEKIYLTELLSDVSGDTFFPEIPCQQFEVIHTEALLDDGQSCRFQIFQRR